MASSGEEMSGGSPSRAGGGTEPPIPEPAAAGASQLDGAEDFEVLEEDEDDLSELPPLEDVGRARGPLREGAQSSERGPGEAAEEPQEWLDVLGESRAGGRQGVRRML